MARTVGSTGEKTYHAIARAAISLFAERGYAAVSMRAIAERVGIQVGALYNHFKTKQDVLATVMVGHLEDVLAAWDRVYDEEHDPVMALETLTRFHVRYHIDLHEEVFIAFMELRSLEPDNLATAIRLRKFYEHRVRDILERGRQTGDFKIADAHVSAMGLIAMLTGVTTWYKHDGRLSGDVIEEMYVTMAFQFVGHSGSAPSRLLKIAEQTTEETA